MTQPYSPPQLEQNVACAGYEEGKNDSSSDESTFSGSSRGTSVPTSPREGGQHQISPGPEEDQEWIFMSLLTDDEVKQLLIQKFKKARLSPPKAEQRAFQELSSGPIRDYLDSQRIAVQQFLNQRHAQIEH